MKLYKHLWHVGRAATRNWTIRNYREYCAGAPGKRALLSYLIHPLLPPTRFRDRALFSPFGIAQQIPRALNELGYSVDIVNFDNTCSSPRGEYDLFIGHGGLNFEHLTSAVGPAVKKIYFASGLHWKVWNEREAERLYELTLRTGHLLPPERIVPSSEGRAYDLSDGIIYLGNAHAGASYNGCHNLHGINNAFYPVAGDVRTMVDFAAGRQHFLYFNGPGNVHKGLDRVLEAFARLPKLHLHVCQQIQPAFRQAYASLLASAPNIHIHGFVRQRSRAFHDLVRCCNWILSATCAEGQPGSVIEMMAHGLIPILPYAANIDLGDWGIHLTDCSIERVRSVCAEASEISDARARAMSEAVVLQMQQHYSIEAFRRNFRNAVSAIVSWTASAEPVAGGEALA
jgi:glycosyltransferase involved in cell wall biosynthesis